MRTVDIKICGELQRFLWTEGGLMRLDEYEERKLRRRELSRKLMGFPYSLIQTMDSQPLE